MTDFELLSYLFIFFTVSRLLYLTIGLLGLLLAIFLFQKVLNLVSTRPFIDLFNDISCSFSNIVMFFSYLSCATLIELLCLVNANCLFIVLLKLSSSTGESIDTLGLLSPESLKFRFNLSMLLFSIAIVYNL